MKYAIVRNGVVEDVIMWDGVVTLPAITGATRVADPDSEAIIGGTYSAGEFAPPTPPAPTDVQYKILAAGELYKSDITLMRCVENDVEIPGTWKTYRAALREIVAGDETGPLPARPAYPQGS